jgi:hypothetical protein
MNAPVLAWHFTAGTLRDGSAIPADGVILRHDGPLVMCTSGYHASERLIDALRYAPGPWIHRVEMSGSMLHENDKLVAEMRMIIWRLDGSDLLWAFARQCALDVARFWQMPALVRRYLETGDEKIRRAARAASADAWAARDARAARAARDAWDAWAASAARDAWAASAAARAARAARAASADASAASAARDAWAASAAARAAWAASAASAARDAWDASAAARAAWAARDAAGDAQNNRLTAMVLAAGPLP